MISSALLLADPSPCLRFLVLTKLMKKPGSDSEVRELKGEREQDMLVKDIIAFQENDGSWMGDTVQGAAGLGKVRTTAMVMKRLGYLGFSPDHPAIKKAAAFLFSHQEQSGAWSPAGNQDQEDAGAEATLIYTALILQGIAMSGYAESPRAKKAYTWLLSFRLPDGAWPAGIVQGNYRKIAGYRRLAHSRFGCRSTTTAVCEALASHPVYRTGKEARRALDLILGTGIKEASSIGYETARLLGEEQTRGLLTYYTRYDSAFILSMCSQVKTGTSDERVAGIIRFLLDNQGPMGLWRYASNPQATRWVTFDILRTLSLIDTETDWFTLEPVTPFSKYPGKQKRF
jgi:hypothetical protein